jgi:Transposase DDE domain group 1
VKSCGESENAGLRLHSDGHLRLQFNRAKVTTDTGLLAVRELDQAPGITFETGDLLTDSRTGKNVRHQLSGLLRQAVDARLAGYEDDNDQEAL